MSMIQHGRAAALIAVAAALALALPATAQSAQDDFHKAYYLEREERDLKGALTLYKRVAESRRASADLRAKARKRARNITEEMASGDFARLVPAGTIWYLELNRPGGQVRKLLRQLGLLGDGRTNGGPKFGISPKLVDGLLGMRGAAVAVTEVDPRRGPTKGVLILHPGDLDVCQGLIETALPVGGQPADPIRGHATYGIEGHAFVTRTSRLLIVSPDRKQIEGVVDRLDGRGTPSFADNKELADIMRMRGDDLVFFCMHFEPLLPMLKEIIQRETRRDPELRAVLALLDIESTRCVAARAGVDANGISFDARLVLDEGHRNIAFNLLRQPGIPKSALSMVPEGAAFFIAGAANRRGKIPPGEADAKGQPVVTLMDFGRELFANLTDFCIYGMPQVTSTKEGPIPDVAIALHVNDPKRSHALWQFVLGTAQAATGGDKSPVDESRIGDTRVERYLVEGVPVFLAAHENDVLVSSSRRAIETSLASRSKGRTVLEDPAFKTTLDQIQEDSVRAAAMNVGRVCQIASHFMSERERQEMAPFQEILKDSSLSLTLQHGTNHLGLSGRISGIPNIGPMVENLIKEEMGHGHRVAMGQGLQRQFETLNVRGLHEAARAVVRRFHQASKDEPNTLNSFAWGLLTENRYKDRYDDLALQISKTSNESTAWKNWFYVDTYAMALFKTGDVENAVVFQRKAVELAGDHRLAGDARKRLEQFEEASRKPGRRRIR